LIIALGVLHWVGTEGQMGVTSVVICGDQAEIGIGAIQPGATGVNVMALLIPVTPVQSRYTLRATRVVQELMQVQVMSSPTMWEACTGCQRPKEVIVKQVNNRSSAFFIGSFFVENVFQCP
jgi:hypothetical protein